MKKTMLFALSSAVLAATLLAGCGNSTTDNAEQGTVVPQVGSAAASTAAAEYIGEDKAKEIALADAGQEEANVTDLQVYLDEDQEGDDPAAYDVEFLVGTDEYDYEIDAATGEIRSRDVDAAKQTAENSTRTADGYITKAKAKKIALDDAGLKSSQAEGMHVVLDTDDVNEGEPAVYDVEFYADMVEYDYEIDAITGDILSRDRDAENISSSDMQASADDRISETKARNIALKHAGFSKSDVTGLYAELDYDDGIYEYEVEFYRDGLEYSYEINAATGEIIKYESEYDD
ncbi:MAG: PepSY domain-containing protein [Butyricicoccus sp.]